MANLTAERVAKNDATFRVANEQIRERAEEHGPPDTIPFLCECAREDCTEILQLTPAVYEEIRTSGRHFLNAPGHDRYDGSEVAVVREAPGYVVVEKQGRTGALVEALDPREED